MCCALVKENIFFSEVSKFIICSCSRSRLWIIFQMCASISELPSNMLTDEVEIVLGVQITGVGLDKGLHLLQTFEILNRTNIE